MCQCVCFYINLAVSQWKLTRVRFCPFAMSVAIPLMVFAFMASSHLLSCCLAHTLSARHASM